LDNEFLGLDLSAALHRTEESLAGAADALLDPWVLIQLGAILLALVVGNLLGAWAEKALEPQVRAIRGQPTLLRLLALILRRMKWIAAALLLAALLFAFREATLPSRSAVIALALSLVAAWVGISIVSRLIRNPTLARLVAAIAWIVVALRITDTFDDVSTGLDRLAVRLGAYTISLYDVIEAALVIAIVLWIASLAGNVLERVVARSRDLTPSLQVLIGKLVKIGLLVAATGVALTILGIDIAALTFFSGALGLGIGFGLQKVVSNFVSGIIILLDKSIKPGDTIAIGDTFGWVRSLRARFVEVITRDGREYLIPNEDFVTQRVENWSFESTLVRVDVEFGVAYDSDPHDVRRLAIAAAAGTERVQTRPVPVCHLTRFGESSLDFILRFWIADPQNGVTNIRGAVLLACWDAFRAAGIDIPFPHRQIVVEKPIPVRLEDAEQDTVASSRREAAGRRA
jgi:small-conductance mechanosensitive channel